MQKFLVATVLVALAIELALCQPLAREDAGEQLAHMLGLDDPREAQRAVEELGTGKRLGLVEVSEEELKAAGEHLERANQLRQQSPSKSIEALVEAQKARSICSKARCPSQVNANSVIHAIEDELDRSGPYAVMGLADTASKSEASSARRKLLRLVHPDKLAGADKQTANYLKHLFDRIEQANTAIQEQN